MAEGILRDKAKEKGVLIGTDSAGTGNYHIGAIPDERAMKCMANHHHDISDLRARQFTISDFDNFDLIFAMDAANYENILKLARNDSDSRKLKLILNDSQPTMDMEVPDPYFGGDAGFEHVYQLLDAACEVLLNKIK
jgi:protein-tyrosine phosphatase